MKTLDKSAFIGHAVMTFKGSRPYVTEWTPLLSEGVQILEGFLRHFNTQTPVPGSKHSASVWLGTSLSTLPCESRVTSDSTAALQKVQNSVAVDPD